MGNMGEGILKKKKKGKEVKRTLMSSSHEIACTNYQCPGHLRNYNIVKRQPPIQQLNRIEIEIYSIEIKQTFEQLGPVGWRVHPSKKVWFEGDAVGAFTTKA